MKNNKKILALLMTMLISGSMEVYASGLNITTANPNANIYNARTGGYNYNANEANASAKVAQPREVLNVLIANPIKSQIPVYTSLTSGKIARYFNVNEVGYCESNAYFLDVYVYSNGFAQVTYFNKQNKDTKIYVKASDLSAGQNILRVDSLAVKTATAPMPLYTDVSKSKVMYTMDKGRTYKILAQQGSMQQVYSYGKGQYRAIGWINATSTISSTGLKGDVNGDGNVNSDDLRWLDQHLKNSSVAISRTDADMNNDGVINYVDYNLLVNFLNPPKPILKGDVNRDGKVDEADYKLLSQYVIGQKVSGFYHYNADMNDDKKFTSTDLSQLRTKLNSMKPTITDSYTVFNIPNGWYEIAPLANESMRLDVDGAREGNEVNIKLYNSNGNVAQRFYVNNVGNGYFTLRTGCNGYVDLKFGQTSNGSNIWQYEKEAANGKCQKFRAIRRNNDAGVFIEPLAKEGIAVACANNSAAAQTNVVVWARENNNYQKWRFIQTSAAPVPVNVDNGLYSIQPQCAPNSELTVLNASKDRSVPVVIYSKNSQNHKQKSHQKWQVTKLNNGYYKITAENSGLALNNHNGSNANGNPITLWDYSGFCQEFRFLDAGNGYYIIQPKNVNGVLDVSGGGSANNTRIQLFQYNGSAAQKWKLERRNPGEDEKQEQSSSYGVWKATARYTANTYDNPNLSGAKAGRVTADSSIEVLGENAKSYYIRYWTDNGTPRELYVERTAVKGLNEKNEIINNNSGDSNKKLLQLCKTWQNRSWQPYGKGDGSNSKWPNGEQAFGGQCLGFANYIFQEIHGRKCGDGYGEIKYKLSRLKEGVKELSSSSWLNSQKAKEMLSNAPVGSFLQLKRRSSGSQHSAILVSKDSNGVRILDANSNLDNVVKYTFWTFSAFANKNTAMSIYNI